MGNKEVKVAGDKLQGVDKATALLMVMGKPLADGIIKQFDDADIRAVARSAMEMPAIDYDRIEAIIDDLCTQIGSGNPVEGSLEVTKELLSGVVAEDRIADLLGEISGEPPKRVWSSLAAVADAKIANFIAMEQPQVAAYILSNLDNAKASSVMEALDIELQTDLVTRLLALKPIGDTAARMIVERIAQELLGAAGETAEGGNHARLGAILNQLGRDQSNGILQRLSARAPDDARKVKKYIFAFEDVEMLSAEDRALLLDEIPSERVVLALRGSEERLVATILSSLSPRSRRIAEAELSTNSNPPLAAVLDARRAIARTALALAEKSVIKLGSQDGPDSAT